MCARGMALRIVFWAFPMFLWYVSYVPLTYTRYPTVSSLHFTVYTSEGGGAMATKHMMPGSTPQHPKSQVDRGRRSAVS